MTPPAVVDLLDQQIRSANLARLLDDLRGIVAAFDRAGLHEEACNVEAGYRSIELGREQLVAEGWRRT